MGRILMRANLPVPLWMVLSASGRTDEPVRMNCEKSPRRSTSLRMVSHSGGMVCHSSIKRGVSPSSKVIGLRSIICRLCRSTLLSPRLSILLACCLAVVVLPHHLGPSIRTAPLPANFSCQQSICNSRFIGYHVSLFLVLGKDISYDFNIQCFIYKFGHLW